MSLNSKNLEGGNPEDDTKDTPMPESKNDNLEEDKEIPAGSPSLKSKRLGKRKADDIKNGKGISETSESKKLGKRPKVADDDRKGEEDIPPLSPSSAESKKLGKKKVDNVVEEDFDEEESHKDDQKGEEEKGGEEDNSNEEVLEEHTVEREEGPQQVCAFCNGVILNSSTWVLYPYCGHFFHGNCVTGKGYCSLCGDR